jgi:signal transduction histidine kinase
MEHLVDKIAAAERRMHDAQDGRRRSDARRTLFSSVARRLAEQPAAPLAEVVSLSLPYLAESCVIEESSNGPVGAIAVTVHVPAAAIMHEAPVEVDADDGKRGVELVVPVLVRGRTVATLTFVRPRGAPAFDSDDRRLAEEFSPYVAIAAEQARIARVAESATHTKAEFLTMMSHELRTPLNAIAGYAQLLELGFRGPLNDAQREAVTRILRSKDHLLELIDAVLTFTRLTGDRPELDSSSIRASEIITMATEPLVEQFAASGIDLRIDCVQDAVLVRADRERAPEVLRHLLSNALKFTPAGGTATVACEVDAHVVRFIVSDTGRGIPASQQEQIFQPFMQVERGLTRSADGSGLGLAVGRELASRMGGSLTVTSVEGQGSRFVLTLGRDVTPPAASIDSQEPRD